MRQVYAHQATLELAPGTDPGAPGAAITVALCGRGEHEPPCPLAPHHTAVSPVDGRLRLRVLFATEPNRVEDVRDRIDAALASGDWRLIDSGCARLDPAERPHGRRLLRPAGPR
ncbi:hypothetical protein Q0Z83_108180 [Actinoplanes sichuanensis]|uniref:Uncharacterized protein n=1 Tax=Actinoplanes sichuanensis TaxID=512349 RepID=A0ABW4AL06_9ACTN|nr:hypothetical protein [Actinoplanes sichuanensis]BEL12627.1 hypothetical protein Q0Z83_108180 [Actinoplanes sichuanensis]